MQGATMKFMGKRYLCKLWMHMYEWRYGSTNS